MSSAGRGFTVFIVDDDLAVRDSLALMLGLLGYATAAFESAEAFLSAWRDDWAGCIVADLRLPGKSGLDLQADLRVRGSRLPFVIITAHGDVPSARAAFQSDAVDFLEKPFDETDLRERVKAAGARWSPERRLWIMPLGLARRFRLAERLAPVPDGPTTG